MRRWHRAAAGVGVCALLSGGACGRPAPSGAPEGVGSFLGEEFERFAPGSTIAGASPGCPTWSGGFTAAALGGGIVARAASGSNVSLSGMLPNRFAPDTGGSVTCEVDCFVESIAPAVSVNFWQPTGGPAGLRMMWGGVNTVPGPCAGSPSTIGAWVNFQAVMSCTNPSTPRFVDTGVGVPIGAWFRLTIEARADGRMLGWLDRFDGAGPVALFDEPMLASGRVDAVAVTNSDAQGAGGLFIDRVTVGGPSVRPPCPGDATRDGRVDFADLNLTLSQYGQFAPPGVLASDMDGDGLVSFLDLNVVIGAFGVACACG